MAVKPIVQAVERAINKTVRDFQKLGFNFITESDIQCCLFGHLREEKLLKARCAGHDVELAHSEFPVKWGNGDVGNRYDMVIWDPEFLSRLDEDALNNLWGGGRPEQARRIPLLIAIEIKYFYGGSSYIKKYLSSKSRIERHNDFIKLTKGSSRYCYFLGFSDEDIKKHGEVKHCFEKMREGFRRARQTTGHRLRVLCVSRDNYDEIRLGFYC
jgi:hypothetical protein